MSNAIAEWSVRGRVDLSICGRSLADQRLAEFLAGVERIVATEANVFGSLRVEVSRERGAYARLQSELKRDHRPPFEGLLRAHPVLSIVSTYQSDDARHMAVDWLETAIMHYELESGALSVVVAETCDNLDQLVAFIVGNLLVSAGMLQALHGSVIRWNDRNILIAGDSGSGKTTFCLTALAAGGSIVTEDVTYADFSSQFISVLTRDFVTVRPGTYAAFRDILPSSATMDSVVARLDTPEMLFQFGREYQERMPLPPRVQASLGPVSEIDVCVIPQFRPDVDRPVLRRVRSSRASAVLDCQLERSIGYWITEAVLPRMHSPDEVLSYPRSRIPPEVPVIALTLGLDYRSRFDEIMCDVAEVADGVRI
jgi:hypothetical protein